MKRVLVLCSILLLLLPFAAVAQDFCEGNFDCDQDVDGTDAFAFKADFGRSGLVNPCSTLGDCPNPWTPCPAMMMICSNACVDSMTDENNCGGCDIPCTGTCIAGVCQPGGEVCDGLLSPLGRWCDQGNGTVKDMTTGLVWLKDAGWGDMKPWREAGDLNQNDDAHTRAGTLASSTGGLSDGSVVGDWRLPTRSELIGITVGDEHISSSQMYSFTNVQASYYWSSTTDAGVTLAAYCVNMDTGAVAYDGKLATNKYVWPVRSGH
jgi:hypothetical protein